MTSAQVVETSVTNNSSFQNYSHPDDHTIRTTDTPGFKPFTINMDCEDISLSLNISEGKCISAKLKRELSCIACNACIKGIASDGMITCKNCQMTTLEENCSHKLVAQLMILTAKGKVQSYTCFNDALQSFLASSNTNLTIDTIDLDELKKLLLTSPAKQMIIDDSTKTITQFLL